MSHLDVAKGIEPFFYGLSFASCLKNPYQSAIIQIVSCVFFLKKLHCWFFIFRCFIHVKFIFVYMTQRNPSSPRLVSSPQWRKLHLVILQCLSTLDALHHRERKGVSDWHVWKAACFNNFLLALLSYSLHTQCSSLHPQPQPEGGLPCLEVSATGWEACSCLDAGAELFVLTLTDILHVSPY